MRTLLSIVVCLTVASGTESAWAVDQPAGCQTSSFDIYAFQSGYHQGEALVRQVFANASYDCDRLDLVNEDVVQRVRTYAPRSSSRYLVCRYSGLVAGILNELTNTWTACDAECCLQGRAIGSITGETYCALSILLEGLPPWDLFMPDYSASGRCQEMSIACCSDEFVGISLDYIGPDLSGNLVQCSLYTVDPWAEVWEGTRDSSCDNLPTPCGVGRELCLTSAAEAPGQAASAAHFP